MAFGARDAATESEEAAEEVELEARKGADTDGTAGSWCGTLATGDERAPGLTDRRGSLQWRQARCGANRAKPVKAREERMSA